MAAERGYTDEDVRLVAEAMLADEGYEDATWDGLYDQGRRVYGARARAALGALAAAGRLLPEDTRTEEWSFTYPDGFVDGNNFTEAGARRYAAAAGGRPVRRWVGPWVPVSEEKP